jgi:hypothetical protein
LLARTGTTAAAAATTTTTATTTFFHKLGAMKVVDSFLAASIFCSLSPLLGKRYYEEHSPNLYS